MNIDSYRDLKVWQEGILLTTSIYRLTNEFPHQELYGLTSQLRRCAVSIPSNVAEGHARLSTREYFWHISIALGSIAELETQLCIAQHLHYGNSDAITAIAAQADRLGKQLRSLKKSLRARISNSKSR